MEQLSELEKKFDRFGMQAPQFEEMAARVSAAIGKIKTALEHEQAAREAAAEAAELSMQMRMEAAAEMAFAQVQAGEDVINIIRREIKAVIAAAIAKEFAKALASLPPGFNLIAAAGVGATVAALFEAVVPSFRGGVTHFEGGLARVHEGELLVNMPTGTNVLTNENTDRLLAAMDRRPSPNVSFSDDRIVRGLGGVEEAVRDNTERLEHVERFIDVRQADEVLSRFRNKQSRT